MKCIRNITDSIVWVGSSDRRLALFENLFPIPDGVAYNSYLIVDEKTALMDTVDSSISQQFLENIAAVLGSRSLDYLIVNHMEPDHCANIEELCRLYPNLKIVGNEKTFRLMSQFYHFDFSDRMIAVKEYDTLALGKHTLHFVFAPMVHWPEAMMTYEDSEKILFSADAFGSFGALDGAIFLDELDHPKHKTSEMRRYYGNIVGKYGPQVQAVLKKAATLDIQMICPLHGHVLRGDFGWVLDLYNKWSSYTPEKNTVAIFYASMYGNTQNAAEILASMLVKAGVKGVTIYDISKTHVSYLISEVFRSSHLVFASPTYNNGIYPAMENLITDIAALNLQNRTIGLIENGSWAPQAGKLMTERFEKMKNMRLVDKPVTIRSGVKEEQFTALEDLKDKLIATL